MRDKCYIGISDFVTSDFSLPFACYLFSIVTGHMITIHACLGFLSTTAVEKD